MKVTAARVCADVRRILNQDERHQSLLDLSDIDTLTLDRRITGMMARAVAETELAADHRLLDSGYSFAEGYDLEAEPAADRHLLRLTVRLPPDFMRLVSFGLTGWEKPLTRTEDPESPTAELMRLPGASALIAGHGPSEVIERRGDGARLTVWCERPAAGEPEVAEAVYRPLPEWDRHGGIEVSRLLYDDAVRRCAEFLRETT